MEKLEDLPNISRVNAGKLRQAGIDTPVELKRLGSREAFLRIRMKADPTACLSTLYGLEGAVRGIRWHGLDTEARQALKAYFDTL